MTTLHADAPGARLRRAWWLHPLLLVLWLGSFLLAAALEHEPHASLWFPPAAVTFAGIFCLGWRAVPAIFLACVAATVLTAASEPGGLRYDVVVESSLVFALVHTGAYALPALLMRHRAASASGEPTLRAVTQFLLYGALGALLAAGFGVAGLHRTELLDSPDLFELAAAWWIGDYAALVTLAPVLALLLRQLGATNAPRFAPFAWGPLPGGRSAPGKLALLFVVTFAILFGYLELSNSRALLVMLVLPVVLQLWIVHTEDLASAQFGVLGFSLLTVGAAAGFRVGEDALILQFAAISIAANSYLSLAAPALYAANAKLRDQVSHDGLTGALSRAFFEDRAAAGLAADARRGRPTSLVMLDLDGLKALNDSQGHAAGDLALRELVQRCQAVVGGEGVVGRLSGDEFAILLPSCDGDRAATMVQAIRERLGDGPVPSLGIAVSASFGIATSGEAASSLSSLLKVADEAMYAEKRRRPRPG